MAISQGKMNALIDVMADAFGGDITPAEGSDRCEGILEGETVTAEEGRHILTSAHDKAGR